MPIVRVSVLSALFLTIATARAGAQTPPVLVATPDLRIDAATANFGSAGALLVARNGDILVIDDKDNVLRAFNAAGPAGTIGRHGEGPGEFKNLRSAGWLGDSLWVYDAALNRVSIFTPNHKFVRTYRVPLSITNPNSRADTMPVNVYFQSVLSDGSLRVMAGFPPHHAPSYAAGLDSGSSLLVRITVAGVLRNRVTVVPPNRCAVNFMPGNGTTYTVQIPFCDNLVATDWNEVPNGLVGRVDPEPATGIASSYRVTVVNERGMMLIHRSYSFVPVPVPKRVLDSISTAHELAGARGPNRWVQFARTVKPSPIYPPIRRIISGRDSTVWLEERMARPGHAWRILDQKGNAVGSVTLPDDVSLQAADMRAIWGYESDADGLQGIVRYRLDRPVR